MVGHVCFGEVGKLLPARLIPVAIESPFAARAGRSVEDHRLYLRHCMLDCLSRGEAPYASHNMYTLEGGGPLDDEDPLQRALGIKAGLLWSSQSFRVACYVDFEMSGGMKAARDHWVEIGMPVEYRTLPIGVSTNGELNYRAFLDKLVYRAKELPWLKDILDRSFASAVLHGETIVSLFTPVSGPRST